jgi:serine protease Do
VAYLGVGVSPVSPALGHQLGLPRGYGLVVDYVDSESPAAQAGIQQHDILLRLEDQILIEARQLSTLVRARSEGDAVQVVYIRGGRENTAQVILAQRMMRPETGPRPIVEGLDRLRDLNINTEEIERRVRQALEAAPQMMPRISLVRPVRAVVVTDDEGTVELRADGDQRHLTVRQADGQEIYSGPINTPEERQALPPEVLSRLEKLEKLHPDLLLPGGPRPAPTAMPGERRTEIRVTRPDVRA